MTIHPKSISCSFIGFYLFNEIWLACHPETIGDIQKASLLPSCCLLFSLLPVLNICSMWWMQRWTFLRLCRWWWEPCRQSRECGPESAKWLQSKEWFHLQPSSAHHMFIAVSQHTTSKLILGAGRAGGSFAYAVPLICLESSFSA